MGSLTQGFGAGMSMRRAWQQRERDEEDRKLDAEERRRRHSREDLQTEQLETERDDRLALRNSAKAVEVQEVPDGIDPDRVERIRQAAGQLRPEQMKRPTQEVTVTDPRLNAGQPTNVPSQDGARDLSAEEATDQALETGERYRASASMEQAKQSRDVRNPDQAVKESVGTVMAKAKRYKAGDKTFDTKDEAQAYATTQNTTAAVSKRMAKTLRSQGKLDKAQDLEDAIRERQEEGEDLMFDAVMAGADAEEVKQVYNSNGYDRLGEDDKVEIVNPRELDIPGGRPIPTADIKITRNGKTRTIRNIAERRYELGDRRIEFSQQAGKLEREAETRADTQSYRNAQLGLSRQRMEQARENSMASQDLQRQQLQSTNALRSFQMARDTEQMRQTGEVRSAQADYYRARAENGGKASAKDTAKALGVSTKDLTATDKVMHELALNEYDVDEIIQPEDRAAAIQQADQAMVEMVELHRNAIQAGIEITPYEASIARKQVQQGQVMRQGDWLVTVLPGGTRTVPVRPYQAPPAPEQTDPGQATQPQSQAATEPATVGDIISTPMGQRSVPKRQPSPNTSGSSFYGGQ